MNIEIKRIADVIQTVFSGEPWYGKSISRVIHEIDPGIVYRKPGPHAHSLIELLYHMVTWSQFTRQRLEKDTSQPAEIADEFHWSETNADIHTWNNGIAQLTASTNKILDLLERFTDEMLEDTVDYRDYNYRFLLNGLVQHNVYHLGQMVYIQKILS